MGVLLDKDSDQVQGRTPQLNLSEGGQQGAMSSPHQWVSGADYVRQKIIAVLISAPAAMRYLPESKDQIAILKSLIEVMPLTIEGLNSSIAWEFSETPVGNAGEMMESVINSTRERSIPSFTWSDKHGMAIPKYFTELGRQLLMYPDLDVPGIVANQAYIEDGSPPLLPEQQSMTVLFIEPDTTMVNVTNSWLVTNMMPKSGGEIIGKREIAGANEVPTVSIEFTGLTMTGRSVTSMAKSYLNSLKLLDLRPLDLKPYAEEISPDVLNAAEGFASKITDSVNPV